jgi:thiol-disulfide isomerase/thioredoxin
MRNNFMEIITNSIRAFKAEWIKLKGTGIWWIIIIGSALMPVVSTGYELMYGTKKPASDAVPWENAIQSNVNSFIFLFVLICILIIVRLCQTEHRSQGWKLIETQPIHRAHLYIGKFKTAMVLSLACLLFYVFLNLATIYLVAVVHQDENYLTNSIPLGPILLYVLRVWVATWGLMAIQYFVSIWLTNFVGPFMIGFVLLIAAGITSALQMGEWNPYGSPGMSSEHFKAGVSGGWMLHNEKLSIAWMLLFLWLGYQYYFYRSWKYAIQGGKQLIKIGVAAAIFAVAFYFIETPVTLGRHTRTVISGAMAEPDSTITRAVLVKSGTTDTLLSIPVRNGNFHGVYEGKPLKQGDYIVVAGNSGAEVYMGDKDSIHIRWGAKIMMNKPRPIITGTRQAENALNQRGSGYGFNLNNLQNYKPAEFTNMVLENWQTEMKTIERFKTTDNIRPSEDFISMKKKLATLSYLEQVKIEYPKMYAMYYPGKKLEYPKTLDTLLHAVGDEEISLLGYADYLEYLDKNLRYQGKVRDLNFDSSYFDLVVNNSKPIEVRNAMLYYGIKGMISNYGDSLKRNQLYNKYIGFQKDPYLAKKSGDQLALENSMTKGMPAPLFDSESLAGNKMNWTDFKGKYVVVDVWATWCVPCKQEDPFFQRYAEMHSSDKMAFVALSIDEGDNLYRWQYEAEAKSKKVVQLRATNNRAFMGTYGIESIPRYMLLDPEGRFVTSSLPRPSDRLFEDYLLRVSEGK